MKKEQEFSELISPIERWCCEHKEYERVLATHLICYQETIRGKYLAEASCAECLDEKLKEKRKEERFGRITDVQVREIVYRITKENYINPKSLRFRSRKDDDN